MKKTLLTLALTGLVFSNCSNQEKDLFKKIDEERKFRISDYRGYAVRIDYDVNEELAYISYDLNKNGEVDAIAVTKAIKGRKKGYELDDFAFILSFNKQGEDRYNTCYIDSDGDWELETRIDKQ